MYVLTNKGVESANRYTHDYRTPLGFVRYALIVPLLAICALISVPVHAQVSRFDFAKGNAATQIAQRFAVEAVLTDYSPTASDATLVLRAFTIVANGSYDAIAPYHPTAVGVYTRLGRRPPEEREDNTLMNIAILHAAHKTLSHLFPDRAPEWDEILKEVGLDPTDLSEDLTTAVGIGNAAGRSVVEGRAHDGMNALGDEGGREHDLRPYADYTGYEPVNTAFSLSDPSRWQPQMQRFNGGNYRIQHFVTPQYRFVEPYSFADATAFGVSEPVKSNYGNTEFYTAQAQNVLDTSLALNDTQRMLAELFDNKISSLGGSGFVSERNARLDLLNSVISNFFTNVAVFDAGIVIWQEKARYDTVRPFSAIHMLFEGQTVGGEEGEGGVISGGFAAEEWASYLPEADHPEYPSATACFCAAHAQFKRRFYGTDDLNWTLSFSAGSSRIQPGIIPAVDLSGVFETWTEFDETCGQSRVWAGVHFQSAVDESRKLCPIFGNMAHDYMQSLISGQAELRMPSTSTQ